MIYQFICTDNALLDTQLSDAFSVWRTAWGSLTYSDMLPCGGSHQTNMLPQCFHIQQLNGRDGRHGCKTVMKRRPSISQRQERYNTCRKKKRSECFVWSIHSFLFFTASSCLVWGEQIYMWIYFMLLMIIATQVKVLSLKDDRLLLLKGPWNVNLHTFTSAALSQFNSSLSKQSKHTHTHTHTHTHRVPHAK